MSLNVKPGDVCAPSARSGTSSITDLAEPARACRAETIRRNMQAARRERLCRAFPRRHYGPEHLEEPPFARRMQVNESGKRAVANVVAKLIQDGDSLILDNGTTTAYLADALSRHSRLVVVTNSAEIACRLASRNGNRVFMAGASSAATTPRPSALRRWNS